MASTPTRSGFGLTQGERSPASKANPLGMSNTAEVQQTIGHPDRSTFAQNNPGPDLGPIATLGRAGRNDRISPAGRPEINGGI